jgi:pyruvate dehydrogenase E2 component (dihydrolipoamide acetyltransferase)
MAKAINMPKVGMLESDITLVAYLKQIGDTVTKGEAIFSIETEKSASDVESPFDGTILKTYVVPGEKVPIGTLLIVIGEEGEDISEYDDIKAAEDVLAEQETMQTEPATVESLASPQAVWQGLEEEGDVTVIKSTPAAKNAAKALDVHLLSTPI